MRRPWLVLSLSCAGCVVGAVSGGAPHGNVTSSSDPDDEWTPIAPDNDPNNDPDTGPDNDPGDEGSAPADVGPFPDDAIRVACVGDSITQGAGLGDQGRDSYPGQMQVMLGNSYHVQNDGHSGATAMKAEVYGFSYWDTLEFTNAENFAPNIVVIALGTNDMNIYDWGNHATFSPDYAALIDVFQSLPSHPVVYACLPPWIRIDKPEVGLTEDRMANVIIPEIEAVASSRGVTTIDLHSATKDHPEYYIEELHPNEAGHAVLAATVRAAIAEE